MKHNDMLPQLLCELMFLGTIKLNIVGRKNVSNSLGCVISSKFHADIQTGSVVQLRNDLMIHALLDFKVRCEIISSLFLTFYGGLTFSSHVEPYIQLATLDALEIWRDDPFQIPYYSYKTRGAVYQLIPKPLC